jgi:hypothetical protein
MIQGLQIVIGGEELGRRIGARIREHQSKIGALEARLKEREGDLSIDVRAEDDFKTIGEQRSEREQYMGRVLTLSLLRDNLIAGESYTLSKVDLRLAELIPPDPDDEDESSTGTLVEYRRAQPAAAIDGLKLTLTGKQVQDLLQERIEAHEGRSEWWKHEQARTPEDQTEDAPLLPEHMCEHEAERHAWRAEVLTFVRDHLDAFEVYRLGANDLEFGELLPEKPGSVEQVDYEERTRIGFQLERLTKRLGELTPMRFVAEIPEEESGNMAAS